MALISPLSSSSTEHSSGTKDSDLKQSTRQGATKRLHVGANNTMPQTHRDEHREGNEKYNSSIVECTMVSSPTPRQESPWSREVPVRVPQGIYPEANTDSLMIMGTEMFSIAVTSHRLFGV